MVQYCNNIYFSLKILEANEASQDVDMNDEEAESDSRGMGASKKKVLIQ